MDRKKWFFGIVAAQVVFLAVWAGNHEFQFQTDPTVMLETVPVDPRDLLRGDYVLLRYKISTLEVPSSLITPPGKWGRSVYVRLVRHGAIDEPDGVSMDHPDPRWGEARGQDFHIIRGTVDRTWGTQMMVSYGIEHFFVPEGKGRNVGGQAVVEVSVSKTGSPQIKRVLLDGRSFP